MSWRRWIGCLALAGVIVHAVALARHNAFALGKALAELHDIVGDLGSDLQVICSAANAADTPATTTGTPAPRGSNHDCPICAGLASAHALAAVDSAVVRPPRPLLAGAFAEQDQRVSIQKRLRPPSRAPPVQA